MSALFSTASTIFSTSSGPGIGRPPGERLVVLNRVHHAAADSSTSARRFSERIRHGQQHALKARPPMPVLRRKICPPKVRLALGSKKRSQRPSALPADRRNRRLIARVHIRPLVPVHLHRDKMLIDDLAPSPGPHTTRGPSHGTSGTTPPQCPAGSACLPLAPDRTPPRPTPSSPPAGASRNADRPKPPRQRIGPSISHIVRNVGPAPRSPSHRRSASHPYPGLSPGISAISAKLFDTWKSLVAPAKWPIPHKFHPSPRAGDPTLRCAKSSPNGSGAENASA
jgi:hypothetical protein